MRRTAAACSPATASPPRPPRSSAPAALSMRTLAARLGVVPAALYRHVRSKEQLYDLLEGRSPPSRTSCGPSWKTTPGIAALLKTRDPSAPPPSPWPRRSSRHCKPLACPPARRPGLPADLRPHQRVRAHRGHRQPRPDTGSPRRSPGDTVRFTHPNLVHARNASRRYGPAGSGSTTPPVAPRRGSRQIAGRAGMQIDRICKHNECTRHDSAAAPNGGSGAQVSG